MERARIAWRYGSERTACRHLANRLQHGYRTGGSAPVSRPAPFARIPQCRKGFSLSEMGPQRQDVSKSAFHRSRRCRRPMDGSNDSISPQGDLLALLRRRWNVETRRCAATTGRPVESDSEERQRLQALLRLSRVLAACVRHGARRSDCACRPRAAWRTPRRRSSPGCTDGSFRT